MKSALKALGGLCSTSLLFGCASLPNETRVTLAPALKVQHSYESAHAFYSMGRYHHGSLRFTEAIKAFQQALEANPGNARTRSALGISYAEQGDHINAIANLMEAAAAEPNNSYHFSNLGYAYMLSGEYTYAEHALEKATSLDPNNVRAWNNLALLVTKLQRHEQAKLIFTRVEHLRNNQSREKSMAALDAPASSLHNAAASLKAFDPLIAQNIPFQLSPSTRESTTQLKEVSPSIYEIQSVAVESVPVAGDRTLPSINNAPLRAVKELVVMYGEGKTEKNRQCIRSSSLWQEAQSHSRQSATPPAVRIEISNGNGIQGMARSLSRVICGQDLEILRLTNQGKFDIATTRIEYSAKYEKAARGLAKYLSHATLSKVENPHFEADIRVVLGTDMLNIDALVSRFTSRFKMPGKNADLKS